MTPSRPTGTLHRRHVLSWTAAFVLAAAMLGACSSDDGGEVIAPGGTIDVATLPPVATTVPAAVAAATEPANGSTATTATVVTATVSPTAPIAPTTVTGPASSTTVRPTTTTTSSAGGDASGSVDDPPCRLDLIVDQTQTMYEGITPADLNCAAGWAAWIGRPDDQFADGFFAVARWTGSAWELANLGTAGVCADAGVPDDLFDSLGCFE